MNVAFAIEDVEGKGRGLICKEFVKEGTPLYILEKDTPNITSVPDSDLEAYFASIDDPKEILNHGFCTNGCYIDLQRSDARFFNHSSNPNSRYDHAAGEF